LPKTCPGRILLFPPTIYSSRKLVWRRKIGSAQRCYCHHKPALAGYYYSHQIMLLRPKIYCVWVLLLRPKSVLAKYCCCHRTNFLSNTADTIEKILLILSKKNFRPNITVPLSPQKMYRCRILLSRSKIGSARLRLLRPILYL